MNKCFLLNPEKKLSQIRLVVFDKNAPLIPKNDITEPNASRLLQLTGYRLNKSQFQALTMVSESLKLTFNLLTVQLVIRIAY